MTIEPRPPVLVRVLGYLGLSGRTVAATPVSPVTRRIGQPLTVGRPILPSPDGDALISSSWTTQPRISADGGTAGPLTVRAASVSGRRHARHGAGREDAYAVGRSGNAVVVAVADGVGDAAARYSAVGAQVAAVEACRIVVSCLDNEWAMHADELCRAIASAMMTSAARFISEGYDEPALATTLTVAWLSPEGRYRGFLVGDGEVFELAADGLAPVAAGRGGGFTETAALPGSWTSAQEFAGRLGPGSALVLTTDGLAVPMRSPDVAAHLARRWQRTPTIVEFLDDVSFERRGESDDRTAIGVWFEPVEHPR